MRTRNPSPAPLSPSQLPLVLDNSVVSNLHRAGVLERVLTLWVGRWLVPLQVKDEAAAWPGEGQRVVRGLEDLRERRILDFVVLDPRAEGALYARLTRTLGQGEAASITIAYHRQYGVALDDYPARRACDRLVLPLPSIMTEGLLHCAVVEGFLALDEARAIWVTMGIADPKRQVL
ncbi:MAG: hypothetical protein ACRDIY_12050 [Chloroflexota bacterium]